MLQIGVIQSRGSVPQEWESPAACVENVYLYCELMILIYEECMKSSPLWYGWQREANFPSMTFAALR